MSTLFSPYQLGPVTLRNRIVVSPMCQYSAEQGMPGPWHMVHLGSRAVGGAGLVFTEATAVSPQGRISPQDAGIWSDEHVEAWRPIAAFLAEQGAVPGMQLAHAGFKASTYRPWADRQGAVPAEDGGWPVDGPGEEPFSDTFPAPRALDEHGIEQVIDDFGTAATRAVQAGFRVVELHAAHGYLLHEFLSPLVNTRTDDYGGSLARRARMPLRVLHAVRAAVGEDIGVAVRLSATDWTKGGLTLEESVQLAEWFAAAGADLIDTSSGGVVPKADIPVGPGYQVPLAQRIRAEAGVPVGAVGMITEPAQAEQILVSGQADLVIMARALLRDPYWPLRAAGELHQTPQAPAQYERAF